MCGIDDNPVCLSPRHYSLWLASLNTLVWQENTTDVQSHTYWSTKKTTPTVVFNFKQHSHGTVSVCDSSCKWDCLNIKSTWFHRRFRLLHYKNSRWRCNQKLLCFLFLNSNPQGPYFISCIIALITSEGKTQWPTFKSLRSLWDYFALSIYIIIFYFFIVHSPFSNSIWIRDLDWV